MVANMEKHAKANGDPFLVVPFMRRCVNRVLGNMNHY